ncbi:MAG: hypothetical protein HFJ65_02845 [Eggerthellaceae bacterium]|nr:hypothetical protein [Eggerthellaceae bacterium]
MGIDEELDNLETAQTEAEQIDEETEIQDVADDMDELLGPEALETDQTHAFASFTTNNEADYNGYDPEEVIEAANDEYAANVLHSEGYHVEDAHDLEEEVIEMEIEDEDIAAYLVDEDDNEIGFVLIDEDGNEQEYYYVDMDEYEVVDDGSEDDPEPHTKVIRAEDGEEFDLGITREGIAEATQDMNVVYKEGAEVLSELKETMDEISESMSFMKKR